MNSTTNMNVEPEKKEFETVMKTCKSSEKPNAIWRVDLLDWVQTKDHQMCSPLIIRDCFSQFVILCKAVLSTDFESMAPLFKGIFRKYGLPDCIQTNSQAPFSSVEAGGLTRLSAWWLKLGIHHETTTPDQTDGQQTKLDFFTKLIHEAIRPVRLNLRAQQIAFTKFTREFNCVQPNQALQNKLPRELFHPSHRILPRHTPSMRYSNEFDQYQVNANGFIAWLGTHTYINQELANETIGAKMISQNKYDLYFGSLKIGCFDTDSNTLTILPSFHLNPNPSRQNPADRVPGHHPKYSDDQLIDTPSQADTKTKTEIIRNEIGSLLESIQDRRPNSSSELKN